MAKLDFFVTHTTDTPYNREITADDIYLWHLGAKNNNNGTYTFFGKKYNKVQLSKLTLELPSGVKIPADKTNGRGWTVVGYSDLIQRSGNLVNLRPYTFDNVIDPWELTNGATGYNAKARHIVLAGGWSKDGLDKNGRLVRGKPTAKIDELYTPEQIKTLIEWYEMQKEIVPEAKIVGHNDLSNKSCPNFIVQDFLRDYELTNLL